MKGNRLAYPFRAFRSLLTIALVLSMLFQFQQGVMAAEAPLEEALTTSIENTDDQQREETDEVGLEVLAAEEPLTIAEARQLAAGTNVTVYGEVTAIIGQNSWIQDGTAAIRLYNRAGFTVNVGQEVTVEGKVAQRFGDQQIEVTTIEVSTEDKITTPDPLIVSVNEISAANAGQIVTLKNVWMTRNYDDSYGGVYVTDDGVNEMLLFAQAEPRPQLKAYLQGLPKSADHKFDVTGINVVFNGVYQLFPRSESDITPVEGAEDPDPGEPEPGEEEFIEATVTHITDGDTIKITPSIDGAEIIRLLSMDTPEGFYLGKHQNPHADEATAALKELIPVGTKIRVKLGVESKDVYGRLLAHLYKDDLDVNKEMIRLGHAVPYFIAPNLAYFEEYRAAYEEAFKAGLGLWDPENPIEELPYVFRFNARGCPDKFVGDYDTKQYVIPSKWEEIETGNRVFFFTKEDARTAGYSPQDANDPDAEPCADDPVAELSTILEARSQAPDTIVRVQGQVIAAFPSNAWIDDGTAGIRLFGNTASNLQVGEEIEVNGKLIDFYTDMEITNPTITKLTGESQFTPPAPFEFEQLSEAGQEIAGRLVQLKHVQIKEDYSTSSGGVVITDGTTEMIVFAQAGADMRTYLQQLSKEKTYNFTGVAASFYGKVQIFPRSEADIQEVVPISGGTIIGTVFAEGRTDHQDITLYTLNLETNEELEYSNVVSAEGSFEISNLAPGKYEIRAQLLHHIDVVASDVEVTAEQGVNVGVLSSRMNGGSGEGKMRAGDLTGDGSIDIYDAVLIGLYYGYTTSDALAKADLNGDGIVDDKDLELVRRNMLFELHKQSALNKKAS